MTYLVPGVDLLVAAIALATILILRDVAALAPSAGLRRAWWVLAGMLGVCITLLFVHAAYSVGRSPGVDALVGVAIFQVGVLFIYANAFLSRRTARDLLRVEDVARDAYRDALTGIGNRRRFAESLDTAVAEAARTGQPLSVVALDVDHFKAVNDGHGHAVGDAVLREVAAALSTAIRPVDTVCRVGGEEFAILCPQLETAFAATLAERLRAEVAALRIDVGEGRAVRVTVSLGLATLVAGEIGPELLRRADAALYAAKRGGRDRLALAA